jgi:hypothetical protein
MSTVATAGTAPVVSTILEQVRTLMFGLNNSWQQSWSINPVTDSNALARLRALYRYVIHYDGDYAKLYPDLAMNCATEHPSEDMTQCINDQLLLQNYNLNVIATNNNLVLDSSRLVEPQCVICLKHDTILVRQQAKNERQVALLTGYLKDNFTPAFLNSTPETDSNSKTQPIPPAPTTTMSTNTTDVTVTGKVIDNANSHSLTKTESNFSGQPSPGGGQGSSPSTTASTTHTNVSNRDRMMQNIVQMLEQQEGTEFAQTTSNYTQIMMNGENGQADVGEFYKELRVNERLHGGRWLYWISAPGLVPAPGDQVRSEEPPPGFPEKRAVHSLGVFGNHELFMTQDDYDKGVLGDFLVFLFPQGDPRLPAPPASGGAQGGGSGGGGSGGGGSGGGGSGGGGSGGGGSGGGGSGGGGSGGGKVGGASAATPSASTTTPTP